MRWLFFVLALLIVVPRPVSGFEGDRKNLPCACSCCHDDCGCQAVLLPCPQILADISEVNPVVAPVLSGECFIAADSLYCREALKDIFRPPPQIA